MQIFVYREGRARLEIPGPCHEITPDWRPPARRLHYQALYRGIHGYLRDPPSHAFHSPALLYLQSLQASYHPSNLLQLHRILWVQAWLSALGEPDSDAETVVQDVQDDEENES